MISEARDYIRIAWWLAFFPGLVLTLTVLATNQMGDWMRDRFDPRLGRSRFGSGDSLDWRPAQGKR